MIQSQKQAVAKPEWCIWSQQCVVKSCKYINVVTYDNGCSVQRAAILAKRQMKAKCIHRAERGTSLYSLRLHMLMKAPPAFCSEVMLSKHRYVYT